jgi:WS/DGAT/MGAT family acyltransferase
MRQLTGVDNLYVALQHGNQSTHVAGLGIYDPSTAPGGAVRFKQILAYFARRLETSKLFRQRLVRAPFHLDRPYWIDDASVDLEFHVRHIALPHPGNWRQLCIQVARIHSRPLDLSRPAWEVYVIEGLDHIEGIPKGSFAMYMKIHHSAMDGEAGVMLLDALHMPSPDWNQEPRPEAQVRIADSDPTPTELLARAVGNRIEQVRQAAMLALEVGPTLFDLGRKQVQRLLNNIEPPEEEERFLPAVRAPVTRFSGTVSPHRVVDALPLALDDIRRIRMAYPETTVNDVFMTVCSGAVRRYLESKNELPSDTLNALIPMSYRDTERDSDAANRIGLIPMPLKTDIADDTARLLALHRSTRRGKRSNRAVGLDLQTRVLQLLPAKLAEVAVRKVMLPMINLTVSNVRGPGAPIYLAGAKCVAFIPISVALDGMGLNITGFSYDGVLWIGTVADRQMMPDPGFFSDCLRNTFVSLLSSADALLAAPPTGPLVRERPARRPGKTAGTDMTAKRRPRKVAKATA